MEEKAMNIEQAAANQADATAEEYTLNFTGEETDNILQHAEKLRSQTGTSDGNTVDTVQVYDTDGVPHTISKAELISKAGVSLPSLDQIGGFVAYDKEGNALGLMSTEQVAEVVGELGLGCPYKVTSEGAVYPAPIYTHFRHIGYTLDFKNSTLIISNHTPNIANEFTGIVGRLFVLRGSEGAYPVALNLEITCIYAYYNAIVKLPTGIKGGRCVWNGKPCLGINVGSVAYIIRKTKCKA